MSQVNIVDMMRANNIMRAAALPDPLQIPILRRQGGAFPNRGEPEHVVRELRHLVRRGNIPPLYLRKVPDNVKIVSRGHERGYDVENERSLRLQFLTCEPVDRSLDLDEVECGVCTMSIFEDMGDDDQDQGQDKSQKHAIVCSPESLSCGHIFHSVCLLAALSDTVTRQGVDSCPTCRFGKQTRYFEVDVPSRSIFNTLRDDHVQKRSPYYRWTLKRPDSMREHCVKVRSYTLSLIDHNNKELGFVSRAILAPTDLDSGVELGMIVDAENVGVFRPGTGNVQSILPFTLNRNAWKDIQSRPGMMSCRGAAIHATDYSKVDSEKGSCNLVRMVDRVMATLHWSEMIGKVNMSWDNVILPSKDPKNLSIHMLTWTVPFSIDDATDNTPETCIKSVKSNADAPEIQIGDGTGVFKLPEKWIETLRKIRIRKDTRHIDVTMFEIRCGENAVGFSFHTNTETENEKTLVVTIWPIGARPGAFNCGQKDVNGCQPLCEVTLDLEENLIYLHSKEKQHKVLPDEAYETRTWVRSAKHILDVLPSRDMIDWHELVTRTLTKDCQLNVPYAWNAAHSLVMLKRFDSLDEQTLPISRTSSHLALAVCLMHHTRFDLSSGLIPYIDQKLLPSMVRRVLRGCVRRGDVFTLQRMIESNRGRQVHLLDCHQRGDNTDYEPVCRLSRELVHSKAFVTYLVCYGRRTFSMLKTLYNFYKFRKAVGKEEPKNPFRFQTDNGIWLVHLLIRRQQIEAAAFLYSKEVADISDLDDGNLRSAVYNIVHYLKDDAAASALSKLFKVFQDQRKVEDFKVSMNKLAQFGSANTAFVFETALMRATAEGKPYTKSWLLSHGADWRIKASDGRTLKDYEKDEVRTRHRAASPCPEENFVPYSWPMILR